MPPLQSQRLKEFLDVKNGVEVGKDGFHGVTGMKKVLVDMG